MKSMWNLRMNCQRHSINLQPFSSFQSKSPPTTFLHPHRSTSNIPSSIKPSSNNPSTESSPSTTVETISSSTTSKTTSTPTTNFIYSPIFPPSSSGSDIFHQIDNDGNVVPGVVASTLHCPTSVATSLDATEIDAPPPRSIHAIAVYPPSTPSIHALSWILPSPSLTSAANVALADDDGWSKLPPSPAYSFNSMEPSHAQEERDFIAKLEATLPPNDFFRIPLALSKPWVGHCLWAFMGGTCADGLSSERTWRCSGCGV